MDVAVDVHDPRLREPDALRLSASVLAEIESLHRGDAEHAMEDWIAVREGDRGSDRDGEHPRSERLVFLLHRRGAARAGEGRVDGGRDLLHVDDRVEDGATRRD